jgi:hypothetical protein
MAQNESPTPVVSDQAVSDMASQVASLQRQVLSLLLVLIVVSGTVSVYLYRQASMLRKDIDNIKPQAAQVVEVFNKNKVLMQNFINQLNGFAQKNPEVQQILLKNGFLAAPVPKK